jgi:hypothetical protein
MPTTYTENNLPPQNALQHHDFEFEILVKNYREDTADDSLERFATPLMHNANTSAASSSTMNTGRGSAPTQFFDLSWAPASGVQGNDPALPQATSTRLAESQSGAVDQDYDMSRPSKHLRVQDEGLGDKIQSQLSSKTITTVLMEPNSGEPDDTATRTKRNSDSAVHPDRISKRRRREVSIRALPLGASSLGARSQQSRKEVDCPVYKHHVMHNTAPPCHGCRVGVMSQVRSHLNPSRTGIHRGFPAFVQQCSRCKQDFIECQLYENHIGVSTCIPRNAIREDITIPWARQYLALYPDALRIPLPWPNERGWLPDSVLRQCRELQVNSPASSMLFPGARSIPGDREKLNNSPNYVDALKHMSHDAVIPTYNTSLRPSASIEVNHNMENSLVPESPSSGPASLDGLANQKHWASILHSFGTQQATIREAAVYLTKEQFQYMAAESQRMSYISDQMYKHHRSPSADQRVGPSYGSDRNEIQNNGGTWSVSPNWTPRVNSRPKSPEVQYFSSVSSESAFLASAQAPTKARNFSVLNLLSSDSGYQSGLGTDTESVISETSTGSSLGVSKHFVQDFVAFFGDALIDKAGARQWAQFAMAHNSPAEIENRLTALLKAFAIHLATRPAALPLDQSIGQPAQDDPSTRVLLDGAIKLIRTHRPMIARYFLDHSVSFQGDPVSLSDHLQGLGRHFSLAERVDLLVHQGIRENDDEDEDNIVDENIIAQLEPVQAMLVSGAAFQNLASELRRSLYRDDEYRTASIRAIVLEKIHFPDTACYTTAQFLAKWDVMGFMRSQYSKLPSVASIVVLTGSALYAQATTCSDYVRTNWPTTGSIVLDLIDKALASEAEKTSALVLGMYTPCHR